MGKNMQVVLATSSLAVTAADGVSRCDVAIPASILDVLEPGDSPVLVIGEHRFDGLVHGQAATVSNRDVDRPVAVRVLAHSPLAVLELARYATALAQPSAARADGTAVDASADVSSIAAAARVRTRLDPGEVVHALDLCAEQTYSGAWLHTVAGLQDPTPSVGQHLRSWLPGGERFLVGHNPPTGVAAVKSARGAQLPPAFIAVVRDRLLVAGQVPATVLDSVTRLAGTRAVEQVAATGDAQSRYGTTRAGELCALPQDPAALLPRDADYDHCPNCRYATPRDSCAFCRRQKAPVIFGGHE